MTASRQRTAGLATRPRASDGSPILRVERIFADTYGVIRRHALSYLVLTLLFGVAPSLMVTAFYGAPPGDLRAVPMAARVGSMALFVLGDAALSGALARIVLDEAEGRAASLARSLGALRGRFLALLVAAAAIDVPILALNLGSSLIPHDQAGALALYGLRFAVGVTLGAIFAGAGAAVLAEGVSGRAALARAAALTRGHRGRTALFFAAFFILKVLGPYLLIDLGLQRLAPVVGATVVAVAGMTVWNLLACALGISTALIYRSLRALSGS